MRSYGLTFPFLLLAVNQTVEYEVLLLSLNQQELRYLSVYILPQYFLRTSSRLGTSVFGRIPQQKEVEFLLDDKVLLQASWDR